ncbi:hypothetical protein DXV76_13530 [Rhodobacteraceae bacterium CCMM004]|nr:hypothetical protein DXV76_13530 [Rhodobacteraceae bacterium CCMM004]
MTTDTRTAPLTRAAIDARIAVHPRDQIVELDFAGLRLHDSADVNAFYDRVEERLAETGEPWWFFLVNYSDSRIDNECWFAFSRRSKALHDSHAMHSARYDTSPENRRQIARDRGTEREDPDLFADREAALAFLRAHPSTRRPRIVHTPSFTREDFEGRVRFLEDEDIMEVDFSHLAFQHSRDVDDFYDYVEARLEATGRRWYFLVNYDGTRIMDAAWVRYAARGKAVNAAWSMGSVRYAPGSETETDIRLRAQSQGFRPNIRNTRAEALDRIAEMKAEAG